MSKIVESVILCDTIMEVFEEHGGFAADSAYFELLTKSEQYLSDKLKKEDFFEYLEFIYGLDGKDFEKAYTIANAEWLDILNGMMGVEQ